MISYQIVENINDIPKYFAAWEHIFGSGEYEASLSIEWSQALLDTHKNGDEAFLIIIRESDKIIGLIPLCLKKVNKFGVSLHSLFPLAEYFNTHSDLLIQLPSEQVIEEFMTSLYKLPKRWDIFRMNRFIETSPLLESLHRVLDKRLNYPYEVYRTEPSYFIRLPNNFREYLQKKSINLQKNIRRASKKMQAMGNISFQGTQDFRNVDDVYSIMLAIEERSWKHKHGTAMTSSHKQREFYRSLCRGAHEKDRLRFCIMNVDNKPVAYKMGLVKGIKYYGVHGSYDETFKSGSPGTLIMARFLEDLIQEGIQEYDWFGEPFQWESSWSDGIRWHQSLLVYNNTLKAKLFHFINKARNMLRRSNGDGFEHCDPREVKPQ